MYEMYPDVWSSQENDPTESGSDAPDGDPAGTVDHPHRRARKEHRTAPRVRRISLDD